MYRTREPDDRTTGEEYSMNSVYLISTYNEYIVDDETYAAIFALVQAHKYCTYTYRNCHPYTQENPCVGRNLCLEHLLEKQKYLVFSGLLRVDNDNRRVYRFLDTRGGVYT